MWFWEVVDVKPTTFGPWKLSLPSPGWTQCSIPNADQENKLSYLKKECCKLFGLSVEHKRRRKTFSPYSPCNKHYESCYNNKIFQQLLKNVKFMISSCSHTYNEIMKLNLFISYFENCQKNRKKCFRPFLDFRFWRIFTHKKVSEF